MMKKALILTVLLASVSALVFSQDDNSQAGNSWAVRNVATWIEAVNGVREGGNNQEYTTMSLDRTYEQTF